MLVKFSSLAGGVFIEVTDTMELPASARCFRFDKNGNAEFAYYQDLKDNGPRARWYGHQYRESDFLFA